MPHDPITNRVIRSIDMTGQRFGRWIVVRRAERPANSSNRDARWEVICECGNTAIVTRSSLVGGDTQSCGCLQRELATEVVRERSITHGMTETSEYNIWCMMKRRCANPQNHSYPRHGGRGITICDRWLNSFENFYADMGPRPSTKHTIDRIDNSLGYSPDNCRWADWFVQQNNRGNNTLVTHDGKTLTLLEWSQVTGIPVKLLRSRHNQGMSPEKLFHVGELTRHPKR